MNGLMNMEKSDYSSKILILSIINSGVSRDLQWKLEEILAVDLHLHQQNQRAIVLMIQKTDWSLYLYDLFFKDGEWVINKLIPLAWEFVKIGYSLFLSEEVKELLKDVN